MFTETILRETANPSLANRWQNIFDGLVPAARRAGWRLGLLWGLRRSPCGINGLRTQTGASGLGGVCQEPRKTFSHVRAVRNLPQRWPADPHVADCWALICPIFPRDRKSVVSGMSV